MSDFTIGRAEFNNLVVREPYVSSRHARMVKHGQMIEVVDLNSSGGTWVNGSKVERAFINPGEDLRLSNRFVFDWTNHTFLNWYNNLTSNQTHDNQLLIGRGDDCDLKVFHHSVSRNHARLSIDDRGLVIEDLSSSGGTAVNGDRVSRKSIQPGAEVVLSQMITLDWNHPVLTHWLKSNGIKSPGRVFWSPLKIIAASLAGSVMVVLSVLLATGTIGFGSSTLFKEGITGRDGHVGFTDNTTGNPVSIYVVDSRDNPIESVEVGFYDQDGFELFVARDPLGRYHPTFEIFPHNSSHTIRMFINDPGVREIDPDSPEGLAYLATVEYVRSNWHYIGQMTDEELDEFNQMNIAILTLFDGGVAKGIYSKVGEITDYAEFLGLIEKPELYNTFSMIPDQSGNLAGSLWIALPAEWDITPVGTPLITQADIGGRFDPIKLPDTAVVFVYAVDQNQIPLNFQRSHLTVQEYSSGDWFNVDFNYQFTGDLSSSVNVSFALDYSGSMDAFDIISMEDAVVQFISMMGTNDGAEIIKFSSYAETVQHWNRDKSRAIIALLSDWAGRGEMTALYDALYLSVDNPDIDAAVVLTDGMENHSTRSPESVTQESDRNNVPIFTIGLGDDCDVNTLRYFSDQTGGFFYYSPGSTELQEVYDKIAGVLENTYRISWKPRHNSTSARVILSLVGIRETMRDTVVVTY